MKQLYRLLLLGGVLMLPAATQAQNWRPFRPNGDVHAFRGASPDTVLTLRLDSAARQGADSVYYFNRIMRRAGNANQYQWRPSVNNQFGQSLRYNPAQRTYTLFWNGGPSTGLSLDRSLVLKPFARVGETWGSAFADVGVQTTLVSRGVTQIDGVQDSVATFRAGNAPGRTATVVLSKTYGLVSGPADLLFGGMPHKTLTQARRPAPAAQSYYNPLAILDLQPGDELGYYYESTTFSAFPCQQAWTLRRVLSRQVTADSVVYTFQQQTRTVTSSAPGCGGPGTTLSSITVVRAAASRRTARWAGNGQLNYQMLPRDTDLLAYAYRIVPTSPGTPTRLVMGHPVVANRAGNTCVGPASLRQEALFQLRGTSTFIEYPAIDAVGWQHYVAEGVGPVRQYERALTFLRRTANGTVQTCGNRADFATLLPTRAAQRAALLKLHPNPAAETATLTLPAPAPAGTHAQLLDELGRTVRRAHIAVGQTRVTLNLRGLSAGLYTVEIQSAGQVPLRARVQHVE